MVKVYCNSGGYFSNTSLSPSSECYTMLHCSLFTGSGSDIEQQVDFRSSDLSHTVTQTWRSCPFLPSLGLPLVLSREIFLFDVAIQWQNPERND